MKLDVYRLFETDRSITGRMTVNGAPFCATLEPARFHPVHPDHPCVPAGVYKVCLTLSPHFGYITPEVLDVPSRTHIRIHRGNEPIDSLGCTLVGLTAGPSRDWINESERAFDRLMELCQAAEARKEEITIEYHDPAQPQSIA